MNTAKHKWDARDYAENSSAQELWAKELINKLSLQGDEYLLDIGCGDGKITYSIAEKLSNGMVVGIDRSVSMLGLAREQFVLPNLFFYTMDATKIDLNEMFDVVFSNAALHWIMDHRAVLDGLKKHLNRHAKVLLQMGGYGNARDVLEIVTQVTTSEKWRKYYHDFIFPYRFCTIEEYDEWLTEAGYEAERVELISKDMVHKDTEGLKGWLRTTWFPYTDQLPDGLKEDFLNTIVEKYASAYPPDTEGRTHVKMVRLEVEAKLP